MGDISPDLNQHWLLAIAGYGYGAHHRNEIWKTDEALWKDVTEKSPNNGRGWMNYGLTQMAKGNYKDADYAYQQALPKVAQYYILHINIGILKEAIGNKTEAEQLITMALLRWGERYVA